MQIDSPEEGQARALQLLEAAAWLRIHGQADAAQSLLQQAHALDPSNQTVAGLLQAPAALPSQSPPLPAPRHKADEGTLWSELRDLLQEDRVAAAVTAVFCCFTVGLAALLGPRIEVVPRQNVDPLRSVSGWVWSFPPGATVRDLDEDRVLGETPLQLTVPLGLAHALELSLPNHESRTVAPGTDGWAAVLLVSFAAGSGEDEVKLAKVSRRTTRQDPFTKRDAVVDPYAK